MQNHRGVAMGLRQVGVSIAFRVLGLGVFMASGSIAAPGNEIAPEQIEGNTFRLERAYLVVVHAPIADVAKVLKSVAAAVGLDYGKYDQVAYIDAVGIEQFRPIEGSKAGAQKQMSRQATKGGELFCPSRWRGIAEGARSGLCGAQL
jgi:hypothetical protein